MGTWKADVGRAAALVTWVFASGGCGGAEDAGEVAALGAGEPVATPAGDSAIDPDDPCASLMAPGEPPARIVWVVDPDGVMEVEIPDSVGMDWAFRYAARTPPGEQAAYTIEYARCGAGQPTCMEAFLPTPGEECVVAYAPRYGVDPEHDHPGLNQYHFSLRLLRGSVVESSSDLTLKVRVVPVPQPP
jgi:hypothetical protein